MKKTLVLLLILVCTTPLIAQKKTITLHFENNRVLVSNPLKNKGVKIQQKGANVIVTSRTDNKDVTYKLTGTTTDGLFKIYSKHAFKLELAGVTLINPDGPAINIQSHKSAQVTLLDGTINTLSDGVVYAKASKTKGDTESQKGTFCSEAKLEFNGKGCLNLNGQGSKAHGIYTNEQLIVNDGVINIQSSAKDGLYGKEGLTINGGTVTVKASGSCLDANKGSIRVSNGTLTCISLSDSTNALNCDSSFCMTGGLLKLALGGIASKGIKSNQNMVLSGGILEITVDTTGKAYLEATGDSGRLTPSYCSAIKCKGTVYAQGTDITIHHAGAGGKGISTTLDYIQSGGAVKLFLSGAGDTCVDETGAKDYYSSTGITSNGLIVVKSGSLSVTNSGTAGKGIKSDKGMTFGTASTNPKIAITTSGTSYTIGNQGEDGGFGFGFGFPDSSGFGFIGGEPMGGGLGFPDSLGGGPMGGGFGFPDSISFGQMGGGMMGGGPMGFGQAASNRATPKAIKSDGAIVIDGGEILVSSNDDGIKSEVSVTFNNGLTTIAKAYEGVEAPNITVNGGTVNATSSDDAFNGTKGVGSERADGSLITLAGGRTNLSSTRGDALDSNGNVLVTGGLTVIQGPATAPEVGIDINGTLTVTGGVVVASGPSSMMMQPTSRDWRSSVYCLLTTSLKGIGTNLFHLQNANGESVVTFKPIHAAYNIYVISPALKQGSTYSIYTGGSHSGTTENGFYTDGTYTPGTLRKTFTLSTTTFVNATF